MDISALIKQVSELNTKCIIVTGGVCSSIGKGILVSSFGVLLKGAGYSLSVMKWDPYFNIDPGTMSPLMHGEVFVTTDGAETDLDFGHYERNIGIQLTRDASITSGQIYQEILEGERQGTFLGKCIQLIPHVVTAIKKRLLTFILKNRVDFILVEIGGTVGDIEGSVFLEAVRQLRTALNDKQILHVHLSYVPFLEWNGEIKTKPTQHSVAMLKSTGLNPDFLFLRIDKDIEESAIEKLSMMCGIKKDCIFSVRTFSSVYNVFLSLDNQGVSEKIQQYFQYQSSKKSDLTPWRTMINLIEQSHETVTIGLIAKYMGNNDPYISVIEAIKSAFYQQKKKALIVSIDAEMLEKNDISSLSSLDGIVVPGGFDYRGIEGKIHAATWARKNKIPYFGLCLGMQIMLIEAARSLLFLEDANSTEFVANTKHPIITLLYEQKAEQKKGASMRLGSFDCSLIYGSLAHQAYKKDIIKERHRHRYTINNTYKNQLESAGIIFSGINKEQNIIEIAEYKDHPFMLGTQFHPEFNFSPLTPHPLFAAFVTAVIMSKNKIAIKHNVQKCINNIY